MSGPTDCEPFGVPPEDDPSFPPAPQSAAASPVPHYSTGPTESFTGMMEQLQLDASRGTDQPQLNQVAYDSNVLQQSYNASGGSDPRSFAPNWMQSTPSHSFHPPLMGTELPYISTKERMEPALLPGSKQSSFNQYSNSIQNLMQSTCASSQWFDNATGNHQTLPQATAPLFKPVSLELPLHIPVTVVDLTQDVGVTQSHHPGHDVNTFHLNQLHGRNENGILNQHLQQTQGIESLDQDTAWPVHQPVQNAVNNYNDPQGSLCQTSFSCQNPCTQVEATNGMPYLIHSEESPWAPHCQNTSNMTFTSLENRQLSNDNQLLNQVPVAPRLFDLEAHNSMMSDLNALFRPQQLAHVHQLDETQMTFNQCDTQSHTATDAVPSADFRHQPLLDHPITSSSVNPFEPLSLSRVQHFFDRQQIRVQTTPNEPGFQQQDSVLPESAMPSRPSCLSDHERHSQFPIVAATVHLRRQKSEMPQPLPRSLEAEIQGLLDKYALSSGSSQGTPQKSQLSLPRTQQFRRKADELDWAPPISDRNKVNRVSNPESQGKGYYDPLVVKYSSLRPLNNASYDQKFEELNRSIDPHMRMATAWAARKP